MADLSMIGVFDSGYGGLTVLQELRRKLPQYDYLYYGDNLRAPYGTRSFEEVYKFTLDAVKLLFNQGCPLVILACNTASAKALRTIQQGWLAQNYPDRRVLGVIRPTAEIIDRVSHNKHVGVLATDGTIRSESYNLEIKKFCPDAVITGLACPEWVPLVESGEWRDEKCDEKVGKSVRQQIDRLFGIDPDIDTVILGCTHYPLLLDKIMLYMPQGVEVLSQGKYVADALTDYLKRHTDIESKLTKGYQCQYMTSGNIEEFNKTAKTFIL